MLRISEGKKLGGRYAPGKLPKFPLYSIVLAFKRIYVSNFLSFVEGGEKGKV